MRELPENYPDSKPWASPIVSNPIVSSPFVPNPIVSKILLLVLVLSASALAPLGCGVASKTKSLFGGDLKMVVTVSENLNQSSPVAVDLVVIYDKALLEQIQALSARDWFRQREQWARDFPKGFDLWSWEWVPEQQIPDQTLSFRLGTSGAFLFADYLEPGAHRQAVDIHEHFYLDLRDSSFSVSPLKQN